MIKLKIHSIVDVITNSSTVIYTYQNSTSEAKDLVNEMIKLSGATDKTADDIFYYGVFCDDDQYFEDTNLPEDCPTDSKEQEVWFENLKLSIMKGEIDQPEWMNEAEKASGWGDWDPDSYLCLIPKNEKYKEFGEKIKALLGSISADGGRDG